jgi:hypothetical protein
VDETDTPRQETAVSENSSNDDDIMAEVLEPEEDLGLHHHRGSDHGGMPLRLDDDELELAVERDRVAAGLADYAPDDVPPATDPLPEGTSEEVDLAQRGLLGDTTA